MKVFAPFLLLVQVSICGYSQSDSSTSNKKVAPWFVKKFRVSAGIFVPVTSTQVQVTVKGGINGTPIDFNKDLGYSDGLLTFTSNFQWSISRRSRVNFNFYYIPRNSTYTLKKDIVFDGATYPANAKVETFFNTAIYQVSYGYAIIAKPRFELGVMIGTHVVGGKVGMSIADVNAGLSDSKNFGFTAPLPDLGIWGGYAFSDRFAIRFDIDYLSLSIDNKAGSIFAYDLLFIYKMAERFDILLGFSGLNFNLDAVKRDATGHLTWGYNGPSLGISYSFGKSSWTH